MTLNPTATADSSRPRVGERFLAIAAWLGHVYLIFYHALVTHPATNSVISDSVQYIRLGLRLAAGQSQSAIDTIWPPGAAALFALTSGMGAADFASSQLLQAVGLALIPLATAVAVFLAAGPRAAWWALSLASLNFAAGYYGGFFFADAWFAIACAGACIAWSWFQRSDSGPFAAVSLAVWAAFSGTIKSPGIYVFIIAVFCGLFVSKTPVRARIIAALLFAATLGIAAAPNAARCTRLNRDTFCSGAINGAMNMALGHAGELSGLIFTADSFGGQTKWEPPVLGGYHQFHGEEVVPASIWNQAGIVAWTLKKISADPVNAVFQSISNAFDLFAPGTWPRGTLAGQSYFVDRVRSQAVAILMVVPAFAALALAIRRRFLQNGPAKQSPDTAVWTFALPVVALLILTMLSLGEPRYRVPWDPFITGLASCGLLTFFGVPPSALRAPAPLSRTLRALLFAHLLIGALLLLAVSWVSWPVSAQSAVGNKMRQASSKILRPDLVVETDDRLLQVKPAGTAFDDPKSYLFTCRPDCPVLKVQRIFMPGETISIAADHNDLYEVAFFNGGAVVETHLLGFDGIPSSPGVRVYNIKPTKSGDEIRVRPILGDGRYSIGHIVNKQNP